MKDIKSQIKSCFNSTTPYTMFDEKNICRFFVVGSSILLLMSAIILRINSSTWVWIVLGIVFGVFLFGYLLLMNFNNKKGMKKLGIQISKNFWSFGANPPLLEFRLNRFYKLMKQQKFLYGKADDILLINEYIQAFQNQKRRMNFTFIGFICGTFLLFIICIWDNLLGVLFTGAKPDDLKWIISITVFLTIVVFAIIYLIALLREFMTAGQNKNERIIEMLEMIKLELIRSNASSC